MILLKELFSSSVLPYTWRRNRNLWTAIFEIDEKSDFYYRLEFVFKNINNENDDLEKRVDIAFYYESDDSIDMKSDLTKSGHEIKVFNTVLYLIKDFLNRKKNINLIKFSAKEDNRKRLYKKIIDKYANSFGFKRITTLESDFLPSDESGYSKNFVLRRFK